MSKSKVKQVMADLKTELQGAFVANAIFSVPMTRKSISDAITKVLNKHIPHDPIKTKVRLNKKTGALAVDIRLRKEYFPKEVTIPVVLKKEG